LRRLGGKVPEPDPNYYCHHRYYALQLRDRCNKPPARMREGWDGVKRWYCAEHDPVRLDHEAKNRKKRDAEKKARWQQMERERRGG